MYGHFVPALRAHQTLRPFFDRLVPRGRSNPPDAPAPVLATSAPVLTTFAPFITTPAWALTTLAPALTTLAPVLATPVPFVLVRVLLAQRVPVRRTAVWVWAGSRQSRILWVPFMSTPETFQDW